MHQTFGVTLRKKWSQNSSTTGAFSWSVTQLHLWHYFGTTSYGGVVFLNIKFSTPLSGNAFQIAVKVLFRPSVCYVSHRGSVSSQKLWSDFKKSCLQKKKRDGVIAWVPCPRIKWSAESVKRNSLPSVLSKGGPLPVCWICLCVYDQEAYAEADDQLLIWNGLGS